MTMQKPKESDWKHFKVVSEVALQRLSQRALDEVQVIATDESQTPHDRYLKLFDEIRKFDKLIAAGFDGFSRSKMMMQILHLRQLQLIEDDEFEKFSIDLQKSVTGPG